LALSGRLSMSSEANDVCVVFNTEYSRNLPG
jgi:hypothetical protein